MHRIDGKLKFGFRDQIKVREFADRIDIGCFQIRFVDRGRTAIRHRPRPQLLFNNLHDGGGRRAPKFRFELDPIPIPGIVARCDHHAAGSTLGFNRVRNGRRWTVIIGQGDWNAGPGDNSGGNPRRVR